MASQKTLARAGASLINRLLISNPMKQTTNHHHLLIPQISTNRSSHSLPQMLQIDPNPARFDAETLKKLASPRGVDFPCGLPSLRFFIDEGDDALPNEPLLFHTHRTYQPSTIKRKRTHGYLARKATKGGRKVIARRIAKGRARIAV